MSWNQLVKLLLIYIEFVFDLTFCDMASFDNCSWTKGNYEILVWQLSIRLQIACIKRLFWKLSYYKPCYTHLFLLKISSKMFTAAKYIKCVQTKFVLTIAKLMIAVSTGQKVETECY